jgi:hypothetical protein
MTQKVLAYDFNNNGLPCTLSNYYKKIMVI